MLRYDSLHQKPHLYGLGLWPFGKSDSEVQSELARANAAIAAAQSVITGNYSDIAEMGLESAAQSLIDAARSNVTNAIKAMEDGDNDKAYSLANAAYNSGNRAASNIKNWLEGAVAAGETQKAGENIEQRYTYVSEKERKAAEEGVTAYAAQQAQEAAENIAKAGGAVFTAIPSWVKWVAVGGAALYALPFVSRMIRK